MHIFVAKMNNIMNIYEVLWIKISKTYKIGQKNLTRFVFGDIIIFIGCKILKENKRKSSDGSKQNKKEEIKNSIRLYLKEEIK